jgi:hypothetical protein
VNSSLCRSDLDVLQSQLLPTRKNLITTLSYIFPIDLASPEDLLFTIVSVPLPIPVAATDPAPPLSLPRHREVTEDSVATSLGYAALVVQLAAAYLGHRLVYPITYVGSRSVIKDDISAMVGPRVYVPAPKMCICRLTRHAVFLSIPRAWIRIASSMVSSYSTRTLRWYVGSMYVVVSSNCAP